VRECVTGDRQIDKETLKAPYPQPSTWDGQGLLNITLNVFQISRIVKIAAFGVKAGK